MGCAHCSWDLSAWLAVLPGLLPYLTKLCGDDGSDTVAGTGEYKCGREKGQLITGYSQHTFMALPLLLFTELTR